jgi:myosin X
VWLGLKGQWLPAWVSQVTSTEITFTSQYNGESYPLHRASLTSDYLMPMHQTSIDTVEDMANLGDLHEASILFNIQQRYLKDFIYSYIGSILCAVNPYKTIENAYSLELMQAYKDKQLGEMPPHIYAISNEIYVSLWRMRQNQCALISGESGAGKTESTKFILSFLSCMSQQAVGVTTTDISVESAILESSPILEAFGNAKTVYNNNSSRFGKFIRLEFSELGNITGGKIIDYLLEKNRVVRQNPMERNYHIFYCLVAGLSPQEKESLQLTEPQSYHYLNQSGCVSDPTIDDVSDFARVRYAFDVMGLAPEQVADVFMVLSGVLHLGNVTYVSAAGAQIAEKSVLETTAGLLSLDPFRLGDALTQKYMVLRGEEITTPLTVQQAEDSRDSTAMSLYASLFRWILQRINVRLKGKEAFGFIGILDIFGFENFEVNRFEQFNINFANEKLQEYFNKHIFSLEQHEYSKEGIDWADIEWVDNAECLDLIERKLGVLDLMDEESRFPKGTDKSLLEKLHGNHKDNPYYVKPKVNNAKFGIRHYAGEVFYDINGLLEKNRDTFRDDILKVLKDSRSDFVYDLFEHLTPGEASGGGGKAGKGMGRQPTVIKRGGRSSRKRATVSSQFKESLHSLMSTLGQANPYFIRCIKPNPDKAPNCFVPDMVLNQLKYSGMMETVRIRRSGYPVRREFKDFLFRYGVLGREVGRRLDDRETCVGILMQYDATNKDWQLGKTKVFYRENLERVIERMRDIQLRAVCRIIFGVVCTVIARFEYSIVYTAFSYCIH